MSPFVRLLMPALGALALVSALPQARAECPSRELARALRSQMREQARSEARPYVLSRRRAPANTRAAHQAITQDLYLGEIFDVRRFTGKENRSTAPPMFEVKVRFTDPATGETRVRDAFFKPAVRHPYGQAQMEYVAYYFNRLMGMDYVPPVAFRMGINVEGFTEGALGYRVPDYEPLRKLKRFPASDEAIKSDNRVLNVLLYNDDAHYDNLGEGRHWVDGARSPVFLDWNASLNYGVQRIRMDFYEAPGNVEIARKIRVSTYNSLKRLKAKDFEPLVKAGLLTQQDVTGWPFRGGIMQRRDEILAYFKKLAEKAVSEGRSLNDVFIAD